MVVDEAHGARVEEAGHTHHLLSLAICSTLLQPGVVAMLAAALTAASYCCMALS